MTAEELVTGMRERGYSVLRMQAPPQVIIPRIEADDPLLPWLSRELHVNVREYMATSEGPRCYEARLQTAAVEVDEKDLDPKDARFAAFLAERRALAIWHAAAS